MRRHFLGGHETAYAGNSAHFGWFGLGVGAEGAGGGASEGAEFEEGEFHLAVGAAAGAAAGEGLGTFFCTWGFVGGLG